MKICSIICEYNPLHNGHLAHLSFSKKTTNCDFLVAIMSGNFVQRGEPAVQNKYLRAKNAIYSGADVVIELPTAFATNSADDFAFYGVLIANAIKTNTISFGSECGDIALLQNNAEKLLNPTENDQKIIKESLKKGNSFASSISQTLENQISNTLLSPNDLLATLYIKWAKSINSQMRFITLKRHSNYNDTHNLSNASSSNIRKLFDSGISCQHLMPDFVADSLKTQFVSPNAFNDFLHCFIQTVQLDNLRNINGVTEGIENRIVKYATMPNYESFIQAVKTKRYTMLKIKRILLSSVFSLTKQLICDAKKEIPYIKVLSIRKDKLDFLSYLSTLEKANKLVFLDNINKYKNLSVIQKQLLDIDITASNLYSAITKTQGGQDYTTPLSIID